MDKILVEFEEAGIMGVLEFAQLDGKLKEILNSLSDGWISVEDELPPEGEYFVLDKSENIGLAQFRLCQNYGVFDSDLQGITHWVEKPPLPAPPEDN